MRIAIRTTIEVPIADIRSRANCGYWCKRSRRNSVETWEEHEGKKRFPLDWSRAVLVAIKNFPHLLDFENLDMNSCDLWLQLAAFGQEVFA